MKFGKFVSAFVLTLCLGSFWMSCQGEKPLERNGLEARLEKQLGLLIDSCWNAKNIDVFEQLASADFNRHLNGIPVAKNTDEMEAHIKVFLTAFPDLQIGLEEASVKGHKIFLLWQATGTNTGIYGEMAPTGKKVRINGMSQLYFNDSEELIREDVYFNELDLLQQLGYSISPPNMD